MAKRKPGKYDHLLPKLRALPPQDVAYQLKVEDAKTMLRQCEYCEGAGKKLEPFEAGYDALVPCVNCNGTGRKSAEQLRGNALAMLYLRARINVEQIAIELSHAQLELEAVSQMLVASQNSGKDNDWGAFGASDRALKLATGDTLRVQPEIYPVPKDKAKFRQWCYDNGLRNTMELPVKPMTDLAKLRLLNGEREPEGLDIFVRTKIVWTPLKTEVRDSEVLENAEVF